MSKTATVRARIEPELKETVENIFQQLGLTTTEAIILFYKQVQLQRGLPFEVKIPNQITRMTLEKTEDMFRQLVHKPDDKLMIECYPKKSLLEVLSNLEPLEEDFPDIEQDLLPLDDIEI
ncbi:type II toxin-antitoxin system RelB/DinJ family antitoxin [Geminocystis herdmanii]|uniref:type II toxin-antitoxin system RelB/DinJ family antitoxin n=1 Tax=Geminocystis herdmanii TaxID=669359 RepID=UPI0003448EC3|nr:type II toxin-antitoxin system RelB/DinJ family antitoxin [Geminocystis herdmanii]